MLRFAVMVWLGFSLASLPSIAANMSKDTYLAPYSALLATYVKPGKKNGVQGALVDYDGWAKDTQHAEAMKRLSEVNVESLSSAETAAFWINAYNLLTIDLILRHPEADSITSVGDVLENPWKSFTWPLAGQTMSLNDIEQQALRAKPNDMRVLLALCKGSVSAPDVARDPYTAERLDLQLAAQSTGFITNPTKGVMRWGTVLQISRVFKPRMSLVESKGGIVPFLHAHDNAIPTNAVVQGYFDDDWALNGTRAPVKQDAAINPLR